MPHPDFERCARHITAETVRELLSEMVDIASPTGGEAQMARHLEGRMARAGMETRLQEVDPGRPNAVGVREGAGDGANLLFTGHMDTSYDGNEDYLNGEGFKPRAVHRDGWIWGLGANNMKSGLAGALAAIEVICREDVSLRGDLTLAGVVGEIEKAPIDEFSGKSYSGYGTGTRHLILHGVTADCAILAEPTGLKVSNANMGVVWAKITVSGTISHSVFSNRPGVTNAVRAIHKIQTAVERWIPDYEARHSCMSEHPNVTIAAVRGGWPWRLSRNPAEASLYLDIRTVPGQSTEDIKRELRSVLDEAADEAGRAALSFYVNDPPTLLDADAPLVQAALAAHEEVTGEASAPVIRRPAADSTHFNRYGIPCICYGPGGRMHPDAAQKGLMHAVGEHVLVEDVVTAAKVYLAAALSICSVQAFS
ncbi:MAG: M20/M25/M40 family metallo-hydrolase [Nitrospinae bacterium]|nr:M20/M25/M40 family metallo-hydrolase [Nitrospinota bacterium]